MRQLKAFLLAVDEHFQARSSGNTQSLKSYERSTVSSGSSHTKRCSTSLPSPKCTSYPLPASIHRIWATIDVGYIPSTCHGTIRMTPQPTVSVVTRFPITTGRFAAVYVSPSLPSLTGHQKVARRSTRDYQWWAGIPNLSSVWLDWHLNPLADRRIFANPARHDITTTHRYVPESFCQFCLQVSGFLGFPIS